MKKSALLITLLLFLQLPVFSLKITTINYNIEGSGAKFFGVTQDYVLAREVPVDTKTDFPDEQTLNIYIEDYKKKLNNLRAFETIEVTYKIIENDVIQALCRALSARYTCTAPRKYPRCRLFRRIQRLSYRDPQAAFHKLPGSGGKAFCSA